MSIVTVQGNERANAQPYLDTSILQFVWSDPVVLLQVRQGRY